MNHVLVSVFEKSWLMMSMLCIHVSLGAWSVISMKLQFSRLEMMVLGFLKCVEDSTFYFLEHIIYIKHIYQNPPVGSEI